jgi:transposase
MATDGATTVTPLTYSVMDELTRLRQENELLRADCDSSRHQYTAASNELELLRAVRQQLTEQLQESQRSNACLQHQLQQLLRRYFGRSAEKIDPKQMLLFETLLNQLAPPTSAEMPATPAAPESRKPKGNGHGRRKLPADLPREKIVHDLPENEKPCPCCGKLRHVIGQEISEQLDYVPAKLKVIEHVRLTYACRDCESQAAEGGPQITTAEKPAAPIEKGLAAPGLLAYVIVSKYSDHLPLYRLERILERHGIQITRSTMCGWMAQCADLLTPLYDRMVHKVRESWVIHTDDTPVDVLDRDLDQTRTGRFWVYLGDKEHPFTVFAYTPSRSRDGPMEFLRGWGKDRRVYLQADAFGGYDGIYAGEAGGTVIEVACWAHARRKFYDARTSDAAGSTQALAYIRLLYDVEDEAKEQIRQEMLALDSPDAETVAAARARAAAIRLALRQEKAVPLLEKFKEWLQSQQAERGGPILPKSPMGQAITYAMNQWDAICVYTSNGDLAIDNNASENALRRVAVGRKNWLFCGSDNGGKTAAVLFSLIATCQRHKVEPLAYLRDVLSRLAATPVSQLDDLLPGRWKPAANTHAD